MELYGHPTIDLVEELVRRGARIVSHTGSSLAVDGGDVGTAETDAELRGLTVVVGSTELPVDAELPLLLEIGEPVFESGLDDPG